MSNLRPQFAGFADEHEYFERRPVSKLEGRMSTQVSGLACRAGKYIRGIGIRPGGLGKGAGGYLAVIFRLEK